MGHISKDAVYFLKIIANYKDKKVWAHNYDKDYNLKYSFYFGEENNNIISALTLFEYGRKVCTFTPEAFKEFFVKEETTAPENNSAPTGN